jgi:hypothetical protein
VQASPSPSSCRRRAFLSISRLPCSNTGKIFVELQMQSVMVPIPGRAIAHLRDKYISGVYEAIGASLTSFGEKMLGSNRILEKGVEQRVLSDSARRPNVVTLPLPCPALTRSASLCRQDGSGGSEKKG